MSRKFSDPFTSAHAPKSLSSETIADEFIDVEALVDWVQISSIYICVSYSDSDREIKREYTRLISHIYGDADDQDLDLSVDKEFSKSFHNIHIIFRFPRPKHAPDMYWNTGACTDHDVIPALY